MPYVSIHSATMVPDFNQRNVVTDEDNGQTET